MPAGMDRGFHDAVTDLHTYAMLLESQSEPAEAGLDEELAAVRAAAAALGEAGRRAASG